MRLTDGIKQICQDYILYRSCRCVTKVPLLEADFAKGEKHMDSLLKVIYYLGIASCGAQGAHKILKKQEINWALGIAATCNALGGGVFRDLLLLMQKPYLLSSDGAKDAIVASFAGVVYFVLSKRNIPMAAVDALIRLTDALSLGLFISLGADRALGNHPFKLIALAAGWATGVMGGVLAAVITGERIKKALSASLGYKAIALANTAVYITFCSTGVDDGCSKCIVIYTSAIGALLCGCYMSWRKKAVLSYTIMLIIAIKRLSEEYIRIGRIIKLREQQIRASLFSIYI